MKLIHCADIHLDSPMNTHMSAEQASTRNTEIIRTFLRLVEYAKAEGVRAALISGDLFDGDRIRSRTVDEVLNAMETAPEVDFLYVAGNHDGAARVFQNRDLPRNFRQFGAAWESVELGEVVVSGIEITQGNAWSLYDAIPKVENKFHMVMLHGQVGSVCGVDQVNLRLLKDQGIDYLALGHIHAYSTDRLDDRGTYCYPGCLEGRGFDECGEKGFMLLDVADGRMTAQFVPFSSRKLHRIPVDVTGLTKNHEVSQAMVAASDGVDRRDMVEFLLTGHRDPTANIVLSYLEDMVKGRFFFTKIKDETRMAIDPEDYKNDVSLKGEFIRLVLGSDASEADKAAMIRLGMEALAGEEIEL